jgi:hypothetical protein
MFLKTPEHGYHFDSDKIKIIENHYGAKYLGYWTVKWSENLGWSSFPVDVFYQPNPDVSKGHTHYFGMHISERGDLMISNAESAFSEPITGILTDDDEVIVSRYRHDFVVKEGYMIDGGRDYTRSSGGKFVTINVKDGEFVIKQSIERLLNDAGDYT